MLEKNSLVGSVLSASAGPSAAVEAGVSSSGCSVSVFGSVRKHTATAIDTSTAASTTQNAGFL